MASNPVTISYWGYFEEHTAHCRISAREVALDRQELKKLDDQGAKFESKKSLPIGRLFFV